MKLKGILNEVKNIDFNSKEISYVKRLLKTIGLQRDIGAWYDGGSKKNEIKFQIINGNSIEPSTTEDKYTLTKVNGIMSSGPSYLINGKEETYFGSSRVNIKSQEISGTEDLGALKRIFKQLRNANL